MRKFIFAGVVGATLVGSSFVGLAPASADSLHRPYNGADATTTVIDGVEVTVYDTGKLNRQAWDKENGPELAKGGVSHAAGARRSASGRQRAHWADKYYTMSLNVQNTYAALDYPLKASGSTSVHYSANAFTATGYEDFSNSSAYFTWLGSKPTLWATQINPSMKWWVSGFGVTASYPVGAAWKSEGSGVVYEPGPVIGNNLYNTGLNYQNVVHFSTFNAPADYYFKVNADFLLAGQWYNVSGTKVQTP
jgi:hypothetical protein